MIMEMMSSSSPSGSGSKLLFKEDQRGVTIVELMIVVAVAALIIVLVLVAAPALQRNARNSQRRTDIGAIRGQLTTVQNNNNGTLPEPAKFNTDVLAQIDQGIYKNDGTAGSIGSPATCTTPTAAWDATMPATQVAVNCTSGFVAAIPSVPGSLGSLPTAVNTQDTVYYVKNIALAADFIGKTLPDPVSLHVIGGVECATATGQLSTANEKVGESTGLYVATDLELTANSVVAIVYQLEGETTARCEDNA